MIIAVHSKSCFGPDPVIVLVGAGLHSANKSELYKELCKRAIEIALEQDNALDAVVQAIRALEDDEETNAGIGSNLTREGTVECDASIMMLSKENGEYVEFSGAVGAMKNMKNPIEGAKEVMIYGKKELEYGLIPPLLITGCLPSDIMPERSDDTNSLITEQQKIKCDELMKLIKGNANARDLKRKMMEEEELCDTVGAVCIDDQGNIVSGVSSGGIWLKYPGRIGEAAVYGAGAWAETVSSDGIEMNAATSVTGTGEQIMKTFGAKELTKCVLRSGNPVDNLSNWLGAFVNDTTKLGMYSRKYIGFISVAEVSSASIKEQTVYFGHTTPSMVLAYANIKEQSTKRKIKFVFSTKKDDQPFRLGIELLKDLE